MDARDFDTFCLDTFNQALRALLATLQPTPAADAARKQVVADMQQLVATALPPELHCGVETFGSFRAGLHLPGSDMDFALTGWVHVQQQQSPDDDYMQDKQLELHQWTRSEQEYLLGDLADALEERGLVQGQVERVLQARVPVIKFTHRDTGLHCDFSISRPECAFKAEMQKLLGSLDRRYGQLYRLVKMWAAAHGLNDAASSTLNSWSLGLMVAFYMQCEQPAMLPPIWQLLHRNQPGFRTPRILQNPNITSAALKRTLNLAATGAGAYASRKTRDGPDAQSPKTLAELLLGFYEFYGRQMAQWVSGEGKACRASTWWGRWVDQSWPPGKPYIFSVEDPFASDDNTARSVGTHNILSCLMTSSYIAWAVQTSAQLLRAALSGAAVVNGSSSSSNGQQQILSAYCWLFGPAAVLQQQQQRVQLPVSLHDHLQQQIPADLLQSLSLNVTDLCDCSAALADGSSLACPNSNNSCLTDDQRIAKVRNAIDLFKQLLQRLGAPICDVCLADYREIYKRQQDLLAEEKEGERQRLKQREADRQRLLPQQQQQQDGMTRQRSAPLLPPPQQQRDERGYHRSRSSNAAVGAEAAAAAAAAAAQGLNAVRHMPHTAAAAAGGGSSSSAGRRAYANGLEQPIGSFGYGSGSSSSSRNRGRSRPDQTDFGSPPAAAGRGRGRGRRQQQQQQQLGLQQSLDADLPYPGSSGSSIRRNQGRSRPNPTDIGSPPAAAGRGRGHGRQQQQQQPLELQRSLDADVQHPSNSGSSSSRDKGRSGPQPTDIGSPPTAAGRGRGRGRRQQQQQQPLELQRSLDASLAYPGSSGSSRSFHHGSSSSSDVRLVARPPPNCRGKGRQREAAAAAFSAPADSAGVQMARAAIAAAAASTAAAGVPSSSTSSSRGQAGQKANRHVPQEQHFGFQVRE